MNHDILYPQELLQKLTIADVRSVSLGKKRDHILDGFRDGHFHENIGLATRVLRSFQSDKRICIQTNVLYVPVTSLAKGERSYCIYLI